MNRTWVPLSLAAALAACAAPRQEPIEVAALEAPAPDRCAVARADDFEGTGQRQLESYIHGLTRDFGGPVNLRPGDVELAISDHEPKPGPKGVIAGEIACAEDHYRITLYRKALEGRQLYTAYHTAAHEFQHVVQIQRDGLSCDGNAENRSRYEQEARAAADLLVPACTRAAPPP